MVIIREYARAYNQDMIRAMESNGWIAECVQEDGTTDMYRVVTL